LVVTLQAANSKQQAQAARSKQQAESSTQHAESSKQKAAKCEAGLCDFVVGSGSECASTCQIGMSLTAEVVRFLLMRRDFPSGSSACFKMISQHSKPGKAISFQNAT